MRLTEWVADLELAADPPEELVRRIMDDDGLQAEIAAEMHRSDLQRIRFKNLMKSAGIGAGDASDILRSLLKMHPAGRRGGRPPALDDEPWELPGTLPQGWICDAAGVRKVVQRGESTTSSVACYSPVWISERLRDLDTGQERWRLTWHDGKQELSAVCGRGVAQTARKIVDLADRGFPVSSDTAGLLVAWLEAYAAQNLQGIPIAWSVRRMGWTGRGFVWGHGCIGAGVRLDTTDAHGLGQIAAACVARKDAAAEATLHRLRVDYPALMVATAASLASVSLHPLHAHGFAVSVDGRTSAGKTTWLRVAASAWGDPDERTGLVRTWDTTAYYAQRDAATLHHLPMCLDDTRRWKGRPESLGDCVYDLTQGRERGRMASGQVAQEQRTWRLVTLSTGEDPLSQVSTAGGLRARTLQLWGSPFGGSQPQDVAECNAAVAAHYGVDGPAWVRALQEHGPGLVRERWEAWVDAHPVSGDVAGRLAVHAALLCAVAWTAAEWLGWPLPGEDAAELVWGVLLPGVVAGDADADPAERAWAELEALLVAAGVELKVRGECVGRLAGGQWQVLPGWLRQWAEASGYRLAALLRAWAETGRLVRTEADRAASRVQWGEHRPRVYLLRVGV